MTEEVDRDATNKAIRDKVNQKEYEQWLDDLFDGVVKNEGIYNGKDYYTSSGNRRSFSATHYEITLENIVKAMKQGDQKSANTFFGVLRRRITALLTRSRPTPGGCRK